MAGGIISSQKNASPNKLASLLISNAQRQGIHDLHIEPSGDLYIIRARSGQHLAQLDQVNASDARVIIDALRTKANLPALSSRAPQEGTIRSNNTLVNFSSLPVVNGEKIFLRITDLTKASKDLEKLGLSGDSLATVKEVANLTSGLVLVLGEGRTTTMFSIISLFDANKLNISTIENRQTYILPRINQFIAERDYVTQAAPAFRAADRQRSDVIMLSAIDTPQLAELAVNASMNNHLVISSLPVSDPFAASAFLVGLGIRPFAISHVLKLIISQSLTRSQTGVTGNFDVVKMNDHLANLISADLPPDELRQLYRGTV